MCPRKWFESVYPIENSTQRNIHLRCFDHAKADILMKLKALNVSEATKKNIQQEILGSEYGGKRVQGLVDCENEAEFEQNYVTKESQWPEEFRQWIVTSKGRHRSMKDTLQHCMLKPVRIAAGLGNLPNKWDNRHVVLPGTPEHRNTGTSRNIPEQPKNPEHPQKTRNTPEKARNTTKKTRNTPRKPRTPPRKPGTPQKKPGTPQENPEHPA